MPSANKVSEYAERAKKLASLKKEGINPYPAKTKRTHLIKAVLLDFSKLEKAKEKISLAGRLRRLRSHGNLTFANLEDGSGKIQLAVSKKEIGDKNYKIFEKFIDIGDFIEAAGE